MVDQIMVTDIKRKEHAKASEEYISVIFNYEDGSVWKGWVPVEYRRTGVSIPKDAVKEKEYLESIYKQMHPSMREKWIVDQRDFWKTEHPNAGPTKEIFDVLALGGWKCVNCDFPQNPNWARRVQDLKEFGYTLATWQNTKCEKCGKNKVSKVILLKIPRSAASGNGYETWSPKLRKRILKVLGNVDAFEGKVANHLLPDHKFSEIRWDDKTKEVNSDDMTDDEIKAKFQLLTNQRNQQKREVCRACFHSGIRPSFMGINFFYEGGKEWNPDYPRRGKKAEQGCVGCPWYDIEKWREELQKVIREHTSANMLGLVDMPVSNITPEK